MRNSEREEEENFLPACVFLSVCLCVSRFLPPSSFQLLNSSTSLALAALALIRSPLPSPSPLFLSPTETPPPKPPHARMALGAATRAGIWPTRSWRWKRREGGRREGCTALAVTLVIVMQRTGWRREERREGERERAEVEGKGGGFTHLLSRPDTHRRTHADLPVAASPFYVVLTRPEPQST